MEELKPGIIQVLKASDTDMHVVTVDGITYLVKNHSEYNDLVKTANILGGGYPECKPVKMMEEFSTTSPDELLHGLRDKLQKLEGIVSDNLLDGKPFKFHHEKLDLYNPGTDSISDMQIPLKSVYTTVCHIDDVEFDFSGTSASLVSHIKEKYGVCVKDVLTRKYDMPAIDAKAIHALYCLHSDPSILKGLLEKIRALNPGVVERFNKILDAREKDLRYYRGEYWRAYIIIITMMLGEDPIVLGPILDSREKSLGCCDESEYPFGYKSPISRDVYKAVVRAISKSVHV